MQKVTTFLMFEGKAEEAMNFYISLFPNSAIQSISRYGAEGPGPQGSVVHATFTLAGQELMAIDSFVKHAFTFTPAISLYITCQSEAEIDELFARLSEGGSVMMPLDAYPFSPRFGWVADRFGVSWQLTLTPAAQAGDLPAGIGKPAERALAGAGIQRLEQLAGYSEARLKQLHGIGPKALEKLRQALGARGLAFASE